MRLSLAALWPVHAVNQRLHRHWSRISTYWVITGGHMMVVRRPAACAGVLQTEMWFEETLGHEVCLGNWHLYWVAMQGVCALYRADCGMAACVPWPHSLSAWWVISVVYEWCCKLCMLVIFVASRVACHVFTRHPRKPAGVSCASVHLPSRCSLQRFGCCNIILYPTVCMKQHGWRIFQLVYLVMAVFVMSVVRVYLLDAATAVCCDSVSSVSSGTL
jgi:hypothetical protein